MIIDRDLIRAINSGRCFIVVGSGPSIELGLPTWEKLAFEAINLVDKDRVPIVLGKIEELIKNKQYPDAFSIVSREIGINKLALWLEEEMATRGQKGYVYKYIVSWPFACYLTTNFDNALKEHFDREKVTILVKGNTKEAFSFLEATRQDVIFKIHGEPNDPENLVLTREQYKVYQSSESKTYWREKIKSVLHMFPVVIVGYSLSDPDFTDQLKYAKENFEPGKPIFMFATGFDDVEITELYTKYNIRIISYENKDGDHKELYKILKRYNHFVASRNSPSIGLKEVNNEEAELASSLFLFTYLRIIEGEAPIIVSAYSVVILKILSELGVNECEGIEFISHELAKRTNAVSHADPLGINQAIDYLQSNSYIILVEPNKYKISTRGMQAISKGVDENKFIYEKFVEACKLFLTLLDSNLSDTKIDFIIKNLENGLARAFKARGFEIARSVYSDIPIDPTDSPDILNIINQEISNLPDSSLYSPFSDLIIEVLLQPNEPMKEYLSVLSQGYFVYHALGYDENCGKERLKIALGTKVIVDSNILIYLIADCCNHNNFASDLIKRARLLDFKLITTKRLINEATGHAEWAFKYIKANIVSKENELSYLLIDKGNSINNIFVEGYVNWKASNTFSTIEDYYDHLFGESWEKELDERIISLLGQYGITIFNIEECDGFDSDKYFTLRDIEICPKIQDFREKFCTFKSDSQCIAEAEVYIICKDYNAKFLSLSTLLNKLENTNVTWTPEAFYRYISMFSNLQPSSDLLYASLTQDFIAEGITIVDKKVISHMLKHEIHQARMSLENERVRYTKAVGEKKFAEYMTTFEQIPDEQKPFYSLQLAHYIATQEIEKRLLAEKKAKDAISGKTLSNKQALHYERLKGKEADRKRKRLRKARTRKSKKKK